MLSSYVRSADPIHAQLRKLEPLLVAVMVRKMLAATGVDLPDRRTFKLTKNKLQNALLALDARGVTAKVGWGMLGGGGVESGGRAGRDRTRPPCEDTLSNRAWG
jgi:hypothetical protein